MPRGGTMDVDNEKRAAIIVQLIRENIDEVATALEHAWALNYPAAKSNQMTYETCRPWTITCIEDVLAVVESDDPSLLNYKNMFSDAVCDPTDFEIAQFASFLSTIKHEARTMAPILFRAATFKGLGAVEVEATMRRFERTFQDIISYSCKLFAESTAEPDHLYSTWDMLSALSTVTSDHPVAQRYASKSSNTANEISQTSAPTHMITPPKSGEELSPCQKDVLDLLLQGKSNAEIAAQLHIAESTTKSHISRLFDKYNVNNRSELIVALMGKK